MTVTERDAVRGASLWSQPKRLRFYSSGRNRPRARRATDVILGALGAIGIAFLVMAAEPPSAFEQALTDLARSLPTFLDAAWQVLAGLLLAWAVVLLLLSVLRGRLDLARDLLLASVGATVLATVIDDAFLDGRATSIWEALRSTGPPTESVSVRLAAVVAATVVASPHITRPFRATSRWLVVSGALSLVILGATTPNGALLGVLCGSLAAAVVHLVFGSAAGQPSLDEVGDALVELGVETGPLSEAHRQTAGVFLVDTTDADGGPLLVKVYGRDAWDSQLLAKAWRALWYRDTDALTLTRLQQAEHEAFVTLLAERSGVDVDHVVKAGRSASNDALIVLRDPGSAMPVITDHPDRRPLLEQVWDAVLALQRAGIVHRDLAPGRFRLDGDTVRVSGFEGATVSPTGDQLHSDLAQLLVTSALLGGTDQSLAVAIDRLGADGLASVIPYLQIAAMGPTLRADVRSADLDLDHLRTATAEAAGADEPAMANLRRVSRSGLIQAALLSAAAYILLSSLSGIDFSEVWDQLQDATWGLLVVALFLGQTPRFSQAESTRGACPRPVAYGPLVLLQFSISFINLVLPSTAARVAVNIRFFQRQGIPPASAVSIGLIDSLGGFAVQLLILTSVLVFGWGDVELHMPADSTIGHGNIITVLVAIGVVAVAAVLVALAFPSVRHRIAEKVKPWAHEVRETVGSLRSPTKVAQVIGGNLGAEILFALTLALVLNAFHSPVPLGTLLVVNVCVSLFAGLMPVPGGIGVTEGALITGLSAAGVDQATAFAVTIVYRMITFYLPPIWGAACFHRLERAGML
ncbi:flippase-like domain-containing protein [Aquihabitans daechungensis]|uniref:flippase-like domain-containing protein n=1 Tax=Aquihabitans daechungensis TaxID=1052257 RepID=UPI003BA37651